MTLDDLERQNGGFMDFGDWLRHIFRERIAPKSLEINRDSLRIKLSALIVVFTSLNFAPSTEFKEFSVRGVKPGYPL